MKKSYTREFKIGLCQAVISGDIGHNDAAEEHGISPIMLYRWISEYKSKGDLAFCGKGSMAAIYGQLDRLREENQRLKKENEFLQGQNAEYYIKLMWYDAMEKR